MDENIVQAYIRINNKMIIVISGLSGSGKTKQADMLSSSLGFKLINQADYHKDKNDSTLPTISTRISENKTINTINWDSMDSVNMDKFYDDIRKYEKEGVVVNAFMLPYDFDADFHIHLHISKAECLKRREKHIKETNEPEEIKKIIVKMYYDYLEKRKNMTFKSIDVSEMSETEVADKIWNILMKNIDNSLPHAK